MYCEGAFYLYLMHIATHLGSNQRVIQKIENQEVNVTRIIPGFELHLDHDY